MNSEEKQELMKLLFNPSKIAVMGASEEVTKIGSMTLRSVLSCGYNKTIYAINPNPKYEKRRIFGIDVYPSLDKCPEPADIVGVVVPPNSVIDSIKQVIENDIRVAVIITAGFGEVKNEDRQNQNKELINTAEKGGLIFVGPNSMGIYTSEDNSSPLHLGFGFMIPRPGKISIVSQSGTMGTLMCNALNYVRHFVSSGNEASLTLEDYLDYYAHDDGTETIALFAEGLRAGKRFKEICLETTKKKPIIFLKAGLTKEGARAANSHTGSIAGTLNIYKSVFKQTGVIFADLIEEFIYLIKGAQYLLPLPNNNRLKVGIISGGGGFVVHMTDLCEREGLNVVDLRKELNGLKLIEDISKLLPFYWSHNNPVDLVATNDFTIGQKIIRLMLRSGCFDVIITSTGIGFQETLKALKPLNEFGERLKEITLPIMEKRLHGVLDFEINVCKEFPDKRIVYISFSPTLNNPNFDKYDKNKVFVSASPQITTSVLKKLHDYQKYINSTSNIKK
ncbi:MAG: CoA-binding protein [Promethearchaeota archaeon]